MPNESTMTEEGRSGTQIGHSNKSEAASREGTTGETMSAGATFRLEKVFIKDSAEGAAGDTMEARGKNHLHLESRLPAEASPPAGVRPASPPRCVPAGKTASAGAAGGQHGGAGLCKTHKIKSSYKSLAAIPTNTLLLDQQAIDEQVERGLSDAAAGGAADTHAEMCSPAELRQQSEELYAVIDDVLASSTPTTSRSQQSSRTSTPTVGLPQNNVSCLKSLGRETKYASCSSLQPSTRVERSLLGPKKTKPGVIRPMTAIPTLRVEDEDEYYRNPFRLCDKETFRGGKKVDSDGASHYQRLREEWKADRSPHSVFDLQITEPSDRRSPVSTSFSPP